MAEHTNELVISGWKPGWPNAQSWEEDHHATAFKTLAAAAIRGGEVSCPPGQALSRCAVRWPSSIIRASSLAQGVLRAEALLGERPPSLAGLCFGDHGGGERSSGNWMWVGDDKIDIAYLRGRRRGIPELIRLCRAHMVPEGLVVLYGCSVGFDRGFMIQFGETIGIPGLRFAAPIEFQEVGLSAESMFSATMQPVDPGVEGRLVQMQWLGPGRIKLSTREPNAFERRLP